MALDSSLVTAAVGSVWRQVDTVEVQKKLSKYSILILYYVFMFSYFFSLPIIIFGWLAVNVGIQPLTVAPIPETATFRYTARKYDFLSPLFRGTPLSGT
jgi:hypothetical protein